MGTAPRHLIGTAASMSWTPYRFGLGRFDLFAIKRVADLLAGKTISFIVRNWVGKSCCVALSPSKCVLAY